MSANITTNQTNTLYIDESNQNWIVNIGGSITVANGNGIVNNAGFDHSVIAVSGDIIADGMYKSGILSAGANAILQVDSMGSIHAYNGIASYGEKTYAENLGHIEAENIGIYANGQNAQISYTGANINIYNAGTIEADTGVYIAETEGELAIFGNAGTIKAEKGFVAHNSRVFMTLDTTSVIDAQAMGLDLASSQGGSNVITNKGLIVSADIAVQGSSQSDRIENYGTIKGKILLGDGDDSFDNRGGAVDHAVDGGAGDDYYVFGDTDFTIIDSSGNDTIGSESTRTLTANNMIENLYLLGAANINGTGNSFVNTITGNDRDNILDGGNDDVTDTLAGGRGNDTFVLRSGHDVVKEKDTDYNLDGGIDTITSTISRSLADYLFVENLKLLGSSNINGTGGERQNVITGNSGNNILDGGIDDDASYVDTLNGGAGNDTYILGSGHDTVIDSAGIDTLSSEISRSLADHLAIENLTLVDNGNVAATGNALVNVISGNAGNNILDGGVDTVIDTLKGGAGNDIYILTSGTDTVIDTGGLDTITSTISRSLASYDAVENLKLVGTANVNATGNALANFISGNSGNNILNGGSDNVVDTLKGDLGNDIYVLGSGADIVSDGGGLDTITSTISRSLASYSTIENLTLLGSGDINATGNGLANVLTGNSGTNTLDGGAGNDTYVLGSGSDKVIDSAGTDTITSTISRSLLSYATIENLTLAGSGNINATGNALANVLTGNAGANTLNGGAGNDTYVLGSGTDKVIDVSGIDTITSLVSRNLSAFATIENLKLLGVSNIGGTGNALANVLIGNAGANTLSGAAGNDMLIGGAGADKLDGGANIDTASYAGASVGVVANLTTTAANTGDAKGDVYVSIENLTGSDHNDTLTGNTGNNVLAGGAGADKLTGGAGADMFLFRALNDTTVATAGQDTIFDFSHTQGDRIVLSGIDANTAMTGDQAFIFKGAAAFSGTNGELRFDKQASDTYVYGDINGDKVADFVIHFDDAIAFQAGDFVL